MGSGPARARALRPVEVAWIALVPCALVTFAALMLLGPPLGRAFFEPGSERLWPPGTPNTIGMPEPVKHARFAIALLGPALLAAVVWVGSRRPPTLAAGTRRALVAGGQLAVGAFLVLALLGERNLIAPPTPELPTIFSPLTLLVAAVSPPLLLLAIRRAPRIPAALARAARDTRARRIACAAVAVAFTAVWLLSAIDSERTIGAQPLGDLITWTLDDPFAILNGRTPLVDFRPLYAALWPYVTAGALALLGTNILVYTLVTAFASALTLLAVYAVFRRVVGSATLALALYLPFVAVGFVSVWNLSNVNIASMWPIRYAGGYLLAWLTARHLDGVAPRRAWLLFLVAGVVAINNLEFGLAALAATLVALLCARPPRTRREVLTLAAQVAAGLVGALTLVTLLTLASAGELPRFGLLFEFQRIFGTLGLVSLPMPLFSFHLVVYATLAAAIGVAAVRLASGEPDRLLTAMLAWSGVFGLLASSYYAGRSDSLKLVSLFSAWCFALALLTVVVVRALAARGWRPTFAHALVLAGFALAVLSIQQTPAPWSQASRLGERTSTPVFEQPEALQFVDDHTRPGERVGILIRLGHRLAYDLHLTNVSPYSFLTVVVTRRQFAITLDALRREGAHKLFFSDVVAVEAHRQALRDAGFTRRAQVGDLELWSDAKRTAPDPGATAERAPRLDDAWPAADGDARNTRNAGGPIDAASVRRLRLAWRLPVKGEYTATPLVRGGVVYSQDRFSDVTALDLRSGRVRWKYVSDEPDLGPNGITLAGGRVVGATPRAVFALDAASGGELWKTRLDVRPDERINMAPGAAHGLVYVSTTPFGAGVIGTIWALDAATGRRVWRWEETPRHLWGDPEVNAGGGMWHPPGFDEHGNLYAGIADPSAWPGTNQEPWARSRPGPNRWNNSLVKLDARSGRFIWGRQIVPHDIYDWDLQCPPILVRVGGRPVVLAGGKMGFAFAFDAESGRLLWKRSVGLHNGHDDDNLRAMRGDYSNIRTGVPILPGDWGGIETQMASDGRTLYVPVNNLHVIYSDGISQPQQQELLEGTGQLVAIDVASGRVRWDTRLPHGVYGGATIANDVVFTTTVDGTLWALRADSGKVVWRSRLPGGSIAPVTVAGDTLLTGTGLKLRDGQRMELVAYRLGER
ncbi:MAG TPA: PQQ-binding-like beta-propeller repeat protein [Conexibacter sp.]